MTVFFNGTFIDDNKINFLPHLFDSHKGFFTTLKFANNKIYFLNEHIQRLKQTAKYLNFEFSDYNFDFIIKQLIQLNNVKRAKVRIMFFNPFQVSCLITLSGLDIIDRPITLKSKVTLRKTDDFKYKLLQFLENIKLIDKAKEKGFDDWLFIDENGFLLESTFSNIFLIYENRIFTPPKFQPILPGVIRKVLLSNELVKDYRFIEKKIHYSEIKNFDAAFITNSIKGIVPIKEIDNFPYQTKKVSTIMKKIDI